MSDRIIRAASVRQVRAWVPQSISASVMSASHGAAFASAASVPTEEATTLFTPEQEMQIRQALEQAHARGMEAGMQQGFEQGLEQGVAQAQSAFDAQQHSLQRSGVQGNELLASLENMLAQLNAQNDALAQQLPQWITQMALAVARQVVGDSALKNPADLARRIQASMENVQENLRERMQLVAHPDTVKQLAQLKSSGLESLLANVRADENMAPGGFVLRTPHGEENQTIEMRWKRAVETFSRDAAHQRWI